MLTPIQEAEEQVKRFKESQRAAEAQVAQFQEVIRKTELEIKLWTVRVEVWKEATLDATHVLENFRKGITENAVSPPPPR